MGSCVQAASVVCVVCMFLLVLPAGSFIFFCFLFLFFQFLPHVILSSKSGA